MEWFIYLLKVTLIQGLFYIVYVLFLKKETTFTANRFYLLITALWSVIFPLLKIKFFTHPYTLVLKNQLPEVFLNSQNVVKNIQKTDYTYVLMYLYGMISVVLAIIFFRKLIGLIHLIRQSNPIKGNPYKIVHHTKIGEVFTFLNYIFVNNQKHHLQYDTVIEHEKVHVRERHTWDLLFFEILKIVYWINPFMYLFQKEITSVHEYIADKKVLKNIHKKQYINDLLNEHFQTQNISFVNSFYNQSLIKNRIIMMTKSKSSFLNLLKYTLTVPVILVTLWIQTPAMAQKVEITEIKDVENDKNVVEDIPFSIIDQAPVFPGCEGLSQKDTKECFSEKIKEHVVSNYNTKLLDDPSLKPGIKRVFVLFVINAEGKVSRVQSRAEDKILEDEAIRVIEKLPTMQPGIQRGKAVNVPYSLPITFNVVEKEKPSKKMGYFTNEKGETIYYATSDDGSKQYYNRFGELVTK